MDFDQIKDSVSDFFMNLPDYMRDYWEKTQAYFQSLDTWEWVGWGGEAVGIILVIVALVLW